MRRPEENEWDEFHDLEIVNWKRTRSAIEHENTLINYRLTWLFTSQIFLFAFFGLVFVAWIKEEVKPFAKHYVPFVLGSTSILGMVVCFAIFEAANAAVTQLDRLQKWWEGLGYNQARHPPIQLWRGLTVRVLITLRFVRR